MKSKSEEFCRASLDTYLMKTGLMSTLFWEEVEKKAEPPDYYLSVNSTRYAVEVTALIEKIDVGAKEPLPVSVIRGILKTFVKEKVESVARNNGCLRGSYLILFSKPITNFADVKDTIQAELLSFISDTQATSKAPPKIVYKSDRQKCSIAKLHNRQDQVVMEGPTLAKWEGEALAGAQQLFDDRLNEKIHRLRSITAPKILLLHDQYHFAYYDTYKICVSNATSLHAFHTIFVVGSDHEGEVLYSEESTWVQSP